MNEICKNSKFLFSCTLFIVLIAYGDSKSLFKQEENVKLSTIVLSDVIREFYIANNIRFDIIMYGETSYHINSVVGKVSKEIGQNVSVSIIHIPSIDKWKHEMNQSAIIFVESIELLHKLHNRYHSDLTNESPKKFKFLVYVEEKINFTQFNESVNAFSVPFLSFQVDFKFYEFFLINDENSIHLIASLLFSDVKCGKFTPKVLNTFDFNFQQWNQKLENFDHYNNFHNCLLEMFAPISYSFYIKDHKEFFRINDKYEEELSNFLSQDNVEYDGLTKEIVSIMADKNNFSYHFSIGRMISNKTYFVGNKNYVGSIFHGFFLDKRVNNPTMHNSKPFSNVEVYYLLSLNDLYTNYEKMSFPFDTATWILLISTFVFAFIIIFIVQRCPERIRLIVFGNNIGQPFYNVIAIFMGISQIRLPIDTFSRVIWLLFIWFCLIFRTCWQSKMFEFMTQDMRKPLPQSVDDFIKMNYTIVLWESMQQLNNELINGRERPQTIISKYGQEFMELYYKTIIGESSSKYAFLVTSDTHTMFKFLLNNSLPVMHSEKLMKVASFEILKNSILLHQIDDILNRWVPTGIVNHLLDYGQWYLLRPIDEEIENPNKILTLSDLEFGFVIFLGFLSLSFVVFISELHALYVRRQFRKLLGLYEFLLVVRERLRDYHDRW